MNLVYSRTRFPIALLSERINNPETVSLDKTSARWVRSLFKHSRCVMFKQNRRAFYAVELRHFETHLVDFRDTRSLLVMTSSDVNCDLLNDVWLDDRLWSDLVDDSALDCTNRSALNIFCERRWQNNASILWDRDLICWCLDISWMLFFNVMMKFSIVVLILDVARF